MLGINAQVHYYLNVQNPPKKYGGFLSELMILIKLYILFRKSK
jgi:hypothetical protein